MDSSKFLILGANGQLGKALQLQYPDAQAVDRSELDITNKTALENFDWSNVTHILNAAAYTNVDGAETALGRISAWEINATAVANLACLATKHDLTFIHVSSEYIFDGTKEIHTESESLSPLSVYGASKAAGDISATTTPKHYIFRTSWMIGEGNNFVRTMINLANKNISPTVVNDQIGRLTFTKELSRAIDHVINTKAEYGIYNLSNSGTSASWADITRQIFKNLNRDDLKVTNTTTDEYFVNKPDAAHRPLQSTLDLSKIESTDFKPNDWEKDLNNYIKEQNL